MIKALYPKYNLLAFKELITLLTRHRNLTLELAKREISDRYAGQIFGLFWTFFHPIIQVIIYIFLFSVVYVARVGGPQNTFMDMTVYILAGFIPWYAVQDTMGKSSTLIINNSNLVKQVIFPIEVLPVKSVIATLVTEFIFYALTIIYILIKNHQIYPIMLILPIFILFQSLGMIGISYILSSVGVYFRDTKDLVQVFLAVVFWLVPILYLPNSIPSKLQLILFLNPLSYLIWCSQDILYFTSIQHPWAWVIFPTLSLVVFIFGYRLFKKLKIMFGNAL